MKAPKSELRPASIRTPMLEGKVAIVTGASRGIGATTAREFAQAGATVVLAARDERSLAAIADGIVAAGGRALAVPTNVADRDSVQRLLARALDAYGRLDAAFNNAGDGYLPTRLADVAVDDFDRVVETNLRGVFLSMKHEIPAMLALGRWLDRQYVLDRGGRRVAWDRCLRRLQARHRRAHEERCARLRGAGHPDQQCGSGSDTDRPYQALSDKQREPISQAVPMRRIGLPEEVATAVAWLCSDQASYITGAVLAIDGGQLAEI